MSVAIRTATRVQDQDDVNVTVGAGVDEYALCWDNDTSKFVLRATTGYDHGLLAAGSLGDDDHTQYALLAGRAGGQTIYGGNAANDDITIHGTSNATRTTSYVLLQPSGGNVGIGTSAPSSLLHVNGKVIVGTGSLAQSLIIDAGGPSGGSLTTSDIFVIKSGTYPYMQFVNNASGGATSDGFKIGIESTAGTIWMKENWPIDFYTNNTKSVTLTGDGAFGIGTALPATILHALTTDTATNAVTNVATLGHNTSGTAAAGFGAGQLFQLESSTTAAQGAARIQALWYEATHATRKADLVLAAYDTAEREGLRIRGAGSAPALGFYGVSPIERATLATGAGASVDDVITALQNLGLVKQS